MSSDESTKATPTEGQGPLGVLNREGELVGTSSQCAWKTAGGQVLVAVPTLRLEMDFLMKLAGGHTWAALLEGCQVTLEGVSYPATFIAGQLKLWVTGSPELKGAGFVLGEVSNLSEAIQGLRKLLT